MNPTLINDIDHKTSLVQWRHSVDVIDTAKIPNIVPENRIWNIGKRISRIYRVSSIYLRRMSHIYRIRRCGKTHITF